MVKVLVEIEASGARALMIIDDALTRFNTVLSRAVPDASVSFEVLGVCNHHEPSVQEPEHPEGGTT